VQIVERRAARHEIPELGELARDEKALSVLHRALPPKLWFYRRLWLKTAEGKKRRARD